MDASAHALDKADIAASLAAMGLIGEHQPFAVSQLSGGVSCDVLLIERDQGEAFVVKRALPRLRVAAEWRAPPERAATEVAWIKLVAGIEPRWVPKILGEDRSRHLFAMQFFPPAAYPVWKAGLAAGHIDVDFAAQVGAALACIHAATAGDAAVAKDFANDGQFRALRLEPYLLFTAERHPNLAQAIQGEVGRIAGARIALMQGDISPKNILCGPDGPVFLDAETACYGDPAFDLAFCLNHFLLKSVWQPQWTQRYAQSFRALQEAYLGTATWEKAANIERRTARLLPMLLLARVDGKSPVEYLTDPGDKAFVRAAAMQMIIEPPQTLAQLAETYFAVAAQRAG